MMSASVSICWSPNIALSMEKTLSAAAELVDTGIEVSEKIPKYRPAAREMCKK